MKRLISLFAALCCFMSVLPAKAESAAAACVLESKTGEIVYEKNSVARLPMASTTKIMTCITALENADLSDIVTVSQYASSQEGSSAYLAPGDEISMQDLLYGLMLNSGNDAAVAVAEHISGSVEAFMELVNAKAAGMGLGNTHFTNPNGLPDDEHYTSAYDLAMITRHAMANEAFREIVSTQYYSARIINTNRVIDFANHNRLLREYDGCIGVKTGYTEAAGRCLVTAAERDGLMFVAVTLNDGDDWNDHKAMLDAAFASYTMQQAARAGEKAPYSGYELVYGSDLSVPVRIGGKLKLKVRMNVPDKLNPPVAAGEKIGYAEFVQGKNVLGTVDVCSAVDLYEEPKFGEKLLNRFKHLCERILF